MGNTSLEGQTSVLWVVWWYKSPNYLTITHKINGCSLLSAFFYLLRQLCLAWEETGHVSPRFCFWQKSWYILQDMWLNLWVVWFLHPPPPPFFTSDPAPCKRVWNIYLAVSLRRTVSQRTEKPGPATMVICTPWGTVEGVVPILQGGLCSQREHKARQRFQTRLLSFCVQQPAGNPSS